LHGGGCLAMINKGGDAMKIQKAFEIERMDIHIIPIIHLRISVPEVLNMKYRFQYREISIGFRWLSFIAVLQLNFN
jgi:hypothetical protein